MDKEQAIDLLDNLIGMIEDNQDNDYDTAFRMAIEALKAQLSQEGTTSDQPVATDTNIGDTISRQVAIDRFNVIRPVDPKKDEYTKGIDVGIAMCIVAVKDQPTIQPEPKEGHWIEGGIYRDVIECYCSECGQLMTTAATVRMNYCPNCGAKMRGEQHETD